MPGVAVVTATCVARLNVVESQHHCVPCRCWATLGLLENLNQGSVLDSLERRRASPAGTLANVIIEPVSSLLLATTSYGGEGGDGAHIAG